ncbi:MAG: hypothetical protein J0H00_19575 [Burkholderiales bacterium]|nr:hypothetical protein [Burkholderiales bacterium]
MRSPGEMADAPAAAGARNGQELSYGLLPQVLGYHLRRTQVAIFRHFSRTVAAEERQLLIHLLARLHSRAEAEPGAAPPR